MHPRLSAFRILIRINQNSCWYFGIGYLFLTVAAVCCRKLKRLTIDLGKENIAVANGNWFLTIPRDSGISYELLAFGVHEPLTTRIIENELRSGMICLDIGSNIGYYVLLECQKVGREGRVIAIEPSAMSFLHLMRNIKLNKVDNVEAINLALSDTRQEVPFLQYPQISNWSQVVTDWNKLVEKGISSKYVTHVQAVALDQLAEDISIQRLDFIRMDVEGHESSIVEGGIRTIKKFKPKILVEVHVPLCGLDKVVEMLSLLKRTGYDAKYLVPRSVDNPLTAIMKSIQRLSVEQIINKLIEKTLPEYFTVLFVNECEQVLKPSNGGLEHRLMTTAHP
jgi:FkbM family methyltransferase